MKYQKPYRIALINIAITLSILSILLYVLFHLDQLKRPLAKVDPVHITQVLIESAKQLKARWELGDQEGYFQQKKLRCPKEIDYSPQIDDQYLRCNPNYLQCYFSQHPEFKVEWKGRQYTAFLKKEFPLKNNYSLDKRFYTVVTRSNTAGAEVPSYGVKAILGLKEFPDYSLTVILEDSCHDSYLPQRIYAYGKNNDGSGEEDWTWDNFHRDIYIDKFLVTFRDVIEWIEYRDDPGDQHGKHNQQIDVPSNLSEWAQPATGLTLNEMRKFCAFKGRQLLEAHIYDAATFHPADLSNPRPEQVIRGPYPWTRKKKKDFFDGPTKVNAKQCSLIYTQECRTSFPFEFYSSNDSSWIEFNQILGGYLEALNNPLHPEKNLKASSMYFPHESLWHQLGLRASWDGLDFGQRNFQWGAEPLMPTEKEFYQIGFRCMLFSEGETEEEGV